MAHAGPSNVVFARGLSERPFRAAVTNKPWWFVRNQTARTISISSKFIVRWSWYSAPNTAHRAPRCCSIRRTYSVVQPKVRRIRCDHTTA